MMSSELKAIAFSMDNGQLTMDNYQLFIINYQLIGDRSLQWIMEN